MTIYKSLLRPHLDLGGIIYGQTFNNSFHEGVESIQDNATVTITGAIRGNFRILIPTATTMVQETSISQVSP